ncbi:unnamed protein product [Ceratitis capitata]|uniref:(Mediterranean fruit fly) hypothetical protein n=1 Tax=Ceratitis capitata TaxID=7213 RepID=A0A811V688_CERCA|nr:unnamed protein product [Ceratitis capitata]
MLLARRRVATAMMSTNSGYSNMVSMLLAALLTLACISPAQAAIVNATNSQKPGQKSRSNPKLSIILQKIGIHSCPLLIVTLKI